MAILVYDTQSLETLGSGLLPATEVAFYTTTNRLEPKVSKLWMPYTKVAVYIYEAEPTNPTTGDFVGVVTKAHFHRPPARQPLVQQASQPLSSQPLACPQARLVAHCPRSPS